MSIPIHRPRLARAATLLPVALSGALLAACAGALQPDVPGAIAAPSDQTLSFAVAATGVQIYECRLAAAGGAAAQPPQLPQPPQSAQAPQWAFVAPEAQLLDARGRVVGSHGAGPHWAFADGVRVLGRVKARADADRADAIPWLLLEAQPEGNANRSSGLRSIQRIHTRGGLAPAGVCTAADLGRRARVPYTADYLFYGTDRTVASSSARANLADRTDPLTVTFTPTPSPTSPRSIQ